MSSFLFFLHIIGFLVFFVGSSVRCFVVVVVVDDVRCFISRNNYECVVFFFFVLSIFMMFVLCDL